MKNWVVTLLVIILTVGIAPRTLNVAAGAPWTVLAPANVNLSADRLLGEWYSGFLSGCMYTAISVLSSRGVSPDPEIIVRNCLSLAVYAIRNDLHMDTDWQPTFEELKALAEQE